MDCVKAACFCLGSSHKLETNGGIIKKRGEINGKRNFNETALEVVFTSDTKQEDGTLKWLNTSSQKETVSTSSTFKRLKSEEAIIRRYC